MTSRPQTIRLARLLACSAALLAATAATAATATPAIAQSSPVVDLLLRARMALNDLRYQDADSLVGFVTDIFGARLSQEQRIEALSIAAAARFPEPIAGALQYPEGALEALRTLVRIDPDLRLRDDLRWPGLDSLFLVARATTFAARLGQPRDVELSAGENAIVVQGMATRPARWRAELVPLAGGAPVWTTTTEPTTTPTVRLQVDLSGGTPSVPTGAYTFRVTALDQSSLDSATWRFRTIVDAPTLALDPIPPPPLASQFRPEIAPPARQRGIVLGLALGGLTIGGVQALRSSGELGAGGTADGNTMLIGGLIAVLAGVSGFLDRGKPLPANAAENARIRSDHALAVRLAESENTQRLAAFRATVSFEERQ